MYPDPFSFRPERFLKDGKINPDVKDPLAAFGFGRRICPGRYMAQASAWIAVASILASFDITKAIDVDGSVIEPSGEYTTTMIK
jgi:cytochrome P450